RASNGVLMITTKRGQKGAPQVTFSLKGSVTNQPKALPTLSGPEYTTLIEEAYSNSYGVPLNTSSIREFSNDPNDPYYFYNYGQNTHWVDAITQLGYIQNANLSVGGGGEKARYRASVDYNGQQGTTVGTYFRRLGARVNLDYIVSQRIRFQTDLSYTYLNNDRNYVNNKDNLDNVRAEAYTKMPNMSIYEYDVTGKVTSNYFSPYSNVQGAYSDTYNPVAMAKLGKNKVIGATVVPTFNLIYDIVPSVLKFTSNIGFTVSNTKNNMFLPQDATGVPSTNPYANLATDNDVDVFTTTTISKLLYSPHLGEKNSLIGLLMFETDDKTTTANSVQSANTASSYLEDPSVTSLTNTVQSSMTSGTTENRHVATLANLQYGLLDRYIVNGSIRMDGSSKFGPKRRYAYFPSISGRWRISGEPFMKNLTFLNDFSLKASYGSSGNEPTNNFDYISNYTTSSSTYLGYAAIAPANMELSNYRWETVYQTDLGITMQMFNNRINIDGDWYRKRTKDMILTNLAISSVTGFSNMDMNAATMDNQGWELSIDATVVRTKDFMARLNFNMAKNNNLIKDVSPFFSTQSGSTQVNGSYYVQVEKNTPFGTFYGYKFKGVYKDLDATIARDKNGNKIYDPLGNPVYMKFYANNSSIAYQFQPGDAMYDDINHDGSIDASDVVSLGNSNPTFSGGFGPTFIYKNLSLVAFFTYRYGNDLINRTRMNMENMYSYNNQSTSVLKRWRQPGDVTDMPRSLLNKGFNWLASSRFVEDGSFIRFKQLTLSYKIKNGLKKFGINNMSAYFTIQNLYTWTKYTGQDPEVVVKSTSTNRWAIGYDDSMTPPARTVTVGLDVMF
ncbi:MAG TPA: SusC/RagA family TonB-linked outer membrane protein, partial [Bacteroidales bacterium]